MGRTADHRACTGMQVDKRDHGTPDEWIKRHPQLIRLTGRCGTTRRSFSQRFLHGRALSAEI